MASEESRRGASPSHGACKVVIRDLRRPQRRSSNAYYPDFAYRIDVKRKSLQVLSVVGPSKWVTGVQVESASCYNRLRAEGDARCIEEYGKQLGFNLNTNTTSTFFTAVFECLYDEEVRWVNELPFDAGANELVMSLARHASEWIQYFQRNISKFPLTKEALPNPSHTRLSLVLQLDVINCESWVTRMQKQPFDVRFDPGSSRVVTQGAAKKQKGVRFRLDRGKWVAEYNPPGKRNNKISLGEYDNEAEAGRAADAGMYCYNSKRASYNFDDSPSLLQPYMQQAPQPVSDDKEAVRKWARDFAKLTTSGSFNSSSASSSSGCSPSTASSSCITIPESFNIPSPCSIDFSMVVTSTPSLELLEVDSDLSSVSLPTDCFSPDFFPLQINSSPPPPPPADPMSYFQEDFLQDMDLWNPPSPFDSSSRGDDFLSQFLALGSPANEVERCQIHLISR